MIFVWFRADARRLRREIGSVVQVERGGVAPSGAGTQEPVSRAPKVPSPSSLSAFIKQLGRPDVALRKL